jgi:predicted peptidase
MRACGPGPPVDRQGRGTDASAVDRMRTPPRGTCPRVVVAAVTLTIGALAGCATAPALTTSAASLFERGAVVVDGVSRAYRVHVPPRRAAPPPVILFLHGGGDGGSDNERQLAVGLGPAIVRRLAAGQEVPFLVVFPQCPRFRIWSLPEVERATLAVLDDAIGRYGGDPRRVALVGNSMGGFGAWALAARHPERFTGVVPVAAAVVRPGWTPYPDDARLVPRGRDPRPSVAAAIARAGLPVWIFSGEEDAVEPAREGRRMQELLLGYGLRDARLTVWPRTGHTGTWERAYDSAELWSWLVSLPRR